MDMHVWNILIPVRQDDKAGNGQYHHNDTWMSFETRLARTFGGYTNAGIVDGMWHDTEHDRYVQDKSRWYILGVPNIEEKENLFRKVIQDAVVLFGQQCIFIWSGNKAELVSDDNHA